MGQVQSQDGGDAITEAPSVKPSDQSSPPSMESLLAEAEAFGSEDENASLDEKAKKALDCPCLVDLKKGPCGSQFTGAFLCFLKSTAEEKGSDCVHPFVALQNCIKANPGAFSKDVLEDEEVAKEEKPSQQYKIIPPVWSVEKKQKPVEKKQKPIPKL